jgi:hypothetical protein
MGSVDGASDLFGLLDSEFKLLLVIYNFDLITSIFFITKNIRLIMK